MATLALFLLRLFPPEAAHNIAKGFLRLFQSLFFRLSSRDKRSPSIHLAPLTFRFPNRVGLAAGFDKNAELFPALSCFGFGFIEVGTITPMPQPGNAKPRIWRVKEQGLVNHLGFNSLGVREVKANLQKYRKWVSQVPIFANIGKNRVTPEEDAIYDYELLVKELSSCVDGFVINISSPNTPGLRDLQTPGFLEALDRILVSQVAWVKVAPDLSDAQLKDLCTAIGNLKNIQGVVCTNTSRELASQKGYADRGGYSGPELFRRSLECVRVAREALPKKMVIGVGGVASVSDFEKMRDAGADLVEVYTAFVYQGPRLIRCITQSPRATS